MKSVKRLFRRPLANKEPAKDLVLSIMLGVQCFALFVAAPFSAVGYPGMWRVAELALIVYILLAVLIAPDRTTAIVAIVVSAVALLGGLGLIAVTYHWVILFAHISSVVGFALLGYVVARAIFAPGRINTHRVLGAFVLYLNMGLAFSTLYRLLVDAVPGGFSGLPTDASRADQFAAMVYFSLVTLTSTGYGDITPLHPVARSIANLEAVIGQLYLATVVATLVSRHLESRASSRGRADRGSTGDSV